MAQTYKVKTPNGEIMTLTGPDNAPKETVLQAAKKRYYADPANAPRPDYSYGQLAGKAFTRGKERLKSTFGDTIPAIIASGLGFDDYAKKQLKEAELTEERLAVTAPPQYPSFKDVEKISDAPKFVTETIFEQIPNFATMFVGGVGGSQAAKIGAKKLAEKYTGKKFTEEMAKRQAKGQAAGALLGSYSLNAPEVFQNIYDKTGELATGTSLLFGAAAASLDSVLPRSILKSITPYEKLAISKEILKKSGTNPTLLNKVFTGLAKGAGSEGLTEGAQEAISISAEKLVGNNPQIFDSEDFDRILESSVRGAIAGGGISAVSAPFDGVSTRQPPPTTEQEQEVKKETVATDQAPTVTPMPFPPTKEEEGPKQEAGEQLVLPEVPAPTEKEIKTGKKETAPKTKGAALESLLDSNPEIVYDPSTELASILERDAEGAPIGVIAQWKWEGTSWKKQDLSGKAPKVAVPVIDKTTGKTKLETGKQPTLPFDTLPIPKRAATLEDDIKKSTNNFASIPERTAEAKNLEYNETNNTAYDPKTKKTYTWDAGSLRWQESKDVNETESGTDTTLGINPSIPEQPSDTAPGQTEQVDDRGMGSARDESGRGERREAERDSPLKSPTARDIDTVTTDPRTNQQFDTRITKSSSGGQTFVNQDNPSYSSAQEFLSDLYNEFGKKAVDNFVKRGRLVVLDTHNDVAQYGINPIDVANANAFFRWPHGLKGSNQKFDKQRVGQNFFIANTIRKGTARNLMLHEIGEHYGLEGMLGDKYVTTLLQLNRLRKTDPLVQEAFESVISRYTEEGVIQGDPETGITFLKEVAAYLGETAPQNTWFRQLMGAVKQFLRRLGFYNPDKVTTKDIQDMILYSLNRALAEPAAPAADATIQEASDGTAVITKSKILADEIYSSKTPPGGYNPKVGSKLFKTVDNIIRKTPLATKPAIKRAVQTLGELPTSLRELAMGLAGLPVLDQLYGKYLPAISKLMSLIEKRAGAADVRRARADELANIGLDAVKGNKRKKIKLINKTTGKEVTLEELYSETGPTTKTNLELSTVPDTSETATYSDRQIEEWNEIIYALSRGEKGGMYEQGINPTFKDHQFHPLVGKFKKLPKELQMIALGYVAYYNQQAREYNQAIINNLPQADQRTAQEKRQAIENKLVEAQLVFYVPFKRKGDYVLRYFLPRTGEYKVERFETEAEKEERIRVIQAENAQQIQEDFDPETTRRTSGSMSTQFFNQVLDEIKGGMALDNDGNVINKNDQQLLDNIYGIYLDLFPSSDIKNMMRERKGIEGEIQDVVNGFADTAARMANHIVNLDYRPRFDEQFKDMNAQSKVAIEETIPFDSSMNPQQKNNLRKSLTLAVNDITQKGNNFIYNPVADPISANLGYLSFWSTIAGNVSSAIVNFTQLAIVVYPMLIGKYGFARGSQAFADAFKLYLNGGMDNNRRFMPDKSFGMMNGYLRSQQNADLGLIPQDSVLPQDLLDLYQYGVENSVFKRGLGYELTELREKTAKDYTGVKTKVDAALGWMFQNTERANREITFMAGYLAEKQASPNSDFTSIAKSAQDLTRETHGTSLPDVGPRYFQTGFGKVMFTFKRFAHSMMALILRLYHDTTKAGDARREELSRMIALTSDTAQIQAMEKEIAGLALEKSVARKQLAGIYGMSFVFAGMQGMPLYGTFESLSEAMYAMFGDEDEPYDFNEDVRSVFGDIGYKGPLNKLINLDIASRTGFANLFWRDDPRRIQEIGVLGYTMESLLGPSYSYARSFGRGVEDMSQGYTYRGMEQMMPAFLRNPLKAFRYMDEGARTKNGAQLTDLNGLDAFMQVFGFTNEDLAKAYEQNSAMKNAERNMLHRRSGLLTAAFVARDNGDNELYGEVMKKIDKFNRSSTGRLNPITGKTLTSSYKQRKRAIEESVNGVTLTKKYKEYLQKEFGQ